MNDSLKSLLKLQQIDSEIIFLTEARQKRPAELETDRRRLVEKKGVGEQIAQEIKKLKKESDQRELDLKKNDADMAKLKIALNLAKSNQEYQILKEQIARLSEENNKIEEEILNRLGEIESLERGKRENDAEAEAFQGEFQKKEEEMRRILQGIDEQLHGLTKQREEAIQEIAGDHLQLYERVLNRHGDFALARVENQVCQGCNMSITSQTINLLMIGRELNQCGNCLRILYLD